MGKIIYGKYTKFTISVPNWLLQKQKLNISFTKFVVLFFEWFLLTVIEKSEINQQQCKNQNIKSVKALFIISTQKKNQREQRKRENQKQHTNKVNKYFFVCFSFSFLFLFAFLLLLLLPPPWICLLFCIDIYVFIFSLLEICVVSLKVL